MVEKHEVNVLGPSAANLSAEGKRTPKQVTLLGIKLLAVLLVIAAPALIASQFISGLTGVAFFGVLAALFGWQSGGARVGLLVTASLASLGAISIVLSDFTVVLALLLLSLGVLYGFAAGRGYGGAVLQLPILTPYFMMDAPALFTDPPVIDAKYLVGVMVIMLFTGGWTILVLQLAMPKHKAKPRIVTEDARMPLLYGTILGVISAAVMILGTSTDLKSHWVWVTLTLYVLAAPTQLFTKAKMAGRTLGSLAGFLLVSVLVLTGLPDPVLQALAFPALWLCVLLMVLKKPYWEYTFLLTVTVVLMNSHGVNTLLLDAERLGFTVLGAMLSMFAAFLVNLFFFRRRGITVPSQADVFSQA